MTINLRKLKLTIFLTILITALFSIISYSNALAATTGQQLLTPESEWKRFDDTEENVLFNESWTSGTTTSGYWYNNTYHQINNTTSSVQFNFYGSKLRLIAPIGNTSSINVQVTIDGVDHNFSLYNTSTIGEVLVFEIDSLTLNDHSVNIINKASGYISLDAIDIDETGILKPYSPVTLVSSITLSKSTTDIFTGDSETLISTIIPSEATNQSITWTTSDPSIATVDSTGKVTGVTPGTVAVTATTSDGGLTATCTVNVLPKSITRAKLTITMTNGVNKEYDIQMSEVENFINWYDNRANGTGTSYYTFTKSLNVAPFIKIKQYVIFDKIVSFDVAEYNEV